MGWEKNRLKSKIRELQNTIDDLEKEIKALRKAQEKLRADSLNAALVTTTSHSKALAESDAKTAATAQKVADLEAEVEELNETIEQYENRFKIGGGQNKKLLDLLHASESRVEKLKQQKPGIAAKEIQELKRKLNGTTWQSTARLEAKQALERECEVLRQQFSSLSTTNTNLQQQVNTLRAANAHARAKTTNQKKNHNRNHSDCSVPPAALRQQFQILTAENARLKQLLTVRECQLENEHAKVVVLENDSKDYEAGMRRAQQDARKALTERDRLRARRGEEFCDDGEDGSDYGSSSERIEEEDDDDDDDDDDCGSQRTDGDDDDGRESFVSDQQDQMQRLLRVERRLDRVQNGMWSPWCLSNGWCW